MSTSVVLKVTCVVLTVTRGIEGMCSLCLLLSPYNSL